MWNKKKCPACGKKYLKSTPFHEVRLQTSDQILTIDICENCANLLDQAADSMNGVRNDEPI